MFSGPERRRRGSDEERLQILADAFVPGARVANAYRRHDVSTGLVYTWRRKLLGAGERASRVLEVMQPPAFVEAVMDEDAPAAMAGERPTMIVDLPR